MRQLFVGIDVHSREHSVAILPLSLLQLPGCAWQQTKPFKIRNNVADFNRLDTTIMSHVTDPNQVLIAVDYTGGHYSEPLSYFLQTRGYHVYYLETKANKAARERLLDEENKSDTLDALGAAYLLYLRDLHGLSFRISATPFELGSKAAVLNSLILQRWQYAKLATQATNRLHQFLLAVFPEGEMQYSRQLMRIASVYPTPTDMLKSNGLEKVRLRAETRDGILELATNTVGVPGEVYRELIRDLSCQRLDALAKRDEMTSLLRTLVASHPYGNVLSSFPQLGPVAAATIIGIIKDIDRWPDKKKFKKALGIYNSSTQSGTKVSKVTRGKEGNRHGRTAFFQTSISCVSPSAHDNDFGDYYRVQVANGKPGMKAIVNTMGKMAEIVYHCLKEKEPYRYEGRYRR